MAGDSKATPPPAGLRERASQVDGVLDLVWVHGTDRILVPEHMNQKKAFFEHGLELYAGRNPAKCPTKGVWGLGPSGLTRGSAAPKKPQKPRASLLQALIQPSLSEAIRV